MSADLQDPVEVNEAIGPVLAAIESRRSIMLSAPVGSGGTTLMRLLLQRRPDALKIDLLEIGEVDALIAALLQMASAVPASGRDDLLSTDAPFADRVERLAAAVRATGRPVVVRVPPSWRIWEPTGSAFGQQQRERARALLRALAALPAIWIVSPSMRPDDLGLIVESQLALAPPHGPLSDVPVDDWGPYADAAGALDAEARDVRASPVVWRLAVGVRALGASRSIVDAALARSTAGAVRSLVSAMGDRAIAHGWYGDAVSALLGVRTSVAAPVAVKVARVPSEHESLVTRCLMYGADELRMSPMVRRALADQVGQVGRSTSRVGAEAHSELADHYCAEDGQSDPAFLSGARLVAWIEKLHHYAHAGRDEWTQQVKPGPDFYWERGRHLSLDDRDYAGAIRVYEECVSRFPNDDYAWHYLGYNRELAGRPRATAESAYARAVSLAPRSVWWNGRRVANLIRMGDPLGAERCWQKAIRDIDPEGNIADRDIDLAERLYGDVALAWLEAGRPRRALAALKRLPANVVDASRTLAGCERDAQARIGVTTPEFSRYLQGLDLQVGAEWANRIRATWRLLVRLLGDGLPPPAAGWAEQGALFQLAWNYEHVYIEVEVDQQGALTWFARDKASDAYRGGTIAQDDDIPELQPFLRGVLDA